MRASLYSSKVLTLERTKRILRIVDSYVSTCHISRCTVFQPVNVVLSCSNQVTWVDIFYDIYKDNFFVGLSPLVIVHITWSHRVLA